MSEELELIDFTHPVYETASLYEMEDAAPTADMTDCENLYALPG